jgi:hypothetical protein
MTKALRIGTLTIAIISLSVVPLVGQQDDAPTMSTPDTGAPGPAPSTSGPPPAPAVSENLKIGATAYLWFPGVHGNLSAFDHDLGFKASPSDLLSHFSFGGMGFVGVQYNKLVATSDFIGVALKVTRTKELTIPPPPEISAELKLRNIIFAQKFGYRVVDNERVKIDGLAGFRFWHFGTTLIPTPRLTGNNPYSSQNWVDPVVGARFLVPLGPNVQTEVAGDAGGWGTGSQLEYQIFGGLTYKIDPRWAVTAGWRYLYLSYGPRSPVDIQIAESGVIFGVTYRIKGR